MKFVLKNSSDTRFQKAETRFQNAETIPVFSLQGPRWIPHKKSLTIKNLKSVTRKF